MTSTEQFYTESEVNTMTQECENLYKLCRTSAGFTQEQAAELLNIAPRTLSDCENGKTRVPDDIVDAMSNHYKSPLANCMSATSIKPLNYRFYLLIGVKKHI